MKLVLYESFSLDATGEADLDIDFGESTVTQMKQLLVQ